MAEAIIRSIARDIIADLVPQALEKVGKLWDVKHELVKLKDTVSMLQATLDDAEEQYYQSGQIQVWLEKLKDAFYDAKDVVEEFNIDAMRQELRGHNEMFKEVRTCCHCPCKHMLVYSTLEEEKSLDKPSRTSHRTSVGVGSPYELVTWAPSFYNAWLRRIPIFNNWSNIFRSRERQKHKDRTKMAEAVIGSIAGDIIADLVPQALEKVGKLWDVKHELVKLKDTVSMLQAILDDAEEQYYQSGQIQVWLEKLKDAFYDAKDVVEEFNIDAMRQELRGHNEMFKEVRTFFSSSNQLAFKLKMSNKVRAVRDRIEAIKDDRGFHLDECPKKEWRKREETHSFIREGDIIGRDDDKKTILKFLLDINMKEHVSILPIVGIGGLGKTALAQSLYNDEMVNEHFDLKMWVCVSNDFNVKKVVKNIIECIKKKEPDEVVMERLQNELRAKIDGKRYLLVLDDLWSAKQETWLSLKTLLVGGVRGSKILVTTRLPLVVEIIGTAPPHLLRSLSESASLDLLMQMACRKEEMPDPDMLAIGKEIVRKCSRVPLVIRTVGSLLFFKKTKLEWLRFKDDELPEVSRSEDNIKSVLRLSYDHLPSHLKQCFALCSLFPKDYEIKKQTLVNLWMAEGFIRPSNRSQHLEDIAHGYFMDLLWSNFFQDYQKDTETCKMHDLMHDLACLVAGTECWVAWDDTKSIHERTRHISHGSTSNLMGKLPISRLKTSPLRTFLSTARRPMHQDFLRKPSSEAYLCQLIQSFKRLRILDLHDTNVEKLPRSICKLKHLTYLDLSHIVALKRLPNSITRLQNLQTLNLSRCFALEELPRDIRKLVSLRNLDIDGCWKLSYMPHGLGQLSSLHRLTRFILPKYKALAKNGCKLGELNGLNDIQGSLHIENLGSVTNAIAESRAANLIGKHSLESLVLHWGDYDTDDVVIGDRDEALLGGLQPPSNLQNLTINGYRGESFPKWMMDSLAPSLPNLVVVSFFFCGRCKHLPPLGQLPRLKSLWIWELTESEDIESGHPSTSTPSFPSLLELNIDGCEKLKAMPLAPHLEELSLAKSHPALINIIFGLNKLKSLVIEEMEFLECLPKECWKSLASVESLRIIRCHRLTSLSPLGMRHLSNLVDLYIWDCSELDLCKDESGNNNLILESHGGLQSLRSVCIHSLPKLASLPRWLLQASNLECLKLEDCEELDISTDESSNNIIILDFHGALHHSLRSVITNDLPKLASLPQWLLQANNLERLSISRCGNLEALPEQIKALRSLQRLDIYYCPLLTSLPKGMQRLASLTHLHIFDCEELDISRDESSSNIILDFQGGLQSLRFVDISFLPRIASLPRWLLQATKLEHLEIFQCSNMRELPEQIEALQSLQKLEITDCPSLTSLPEGMRRLTSLTHLIIIGCPHLERRCKRDAGEDWDKIAHIPHMQLGL